MSEEQKEKVPIKRILVPIDGSSYSVKAAKYAIEVARLQKAQVLCIHVIASLPYGYGAAVVTNQAQSWSIYSSTRLLKGFAFNLLPLNKKLYKGKWNCACQW
jgi:nucleotide-binding universal stress UspA family protein